MQEDGRWCTWWGFGDLYHADPGFVLFAYVAHESRPRICTRNEFFEMAEHLAAVADAKSKSVLPFEKFFEHFPRFGVEED